MGNNDHRYPILVDTETPTKRQQREVDPIDYVILMDSAGRRSIRRVVEDRDLDIQVLAPTFIFYILYDNDIISRQEFCEACAEMLRAEGWTGYQAVKAAWEGIPVDCRDSIDSELIP